MAEACSSSVSLWAYDATLASAVAALWWLAEFSSALSQRHLPCASDFNRAWSFLTLSLFLIAFSTVGLEQYIRTHLSVSAPVTIAMIGLASLSYVTGPVRLRLFDARVKLVQRLMRVDKARFGRPGSLGLDKYIIKWSPWKRGNAERSWSEANTVLYRGQQILWDWGTGHRTGPLADEELWKCIHGSEIEFWASIGALLYSWLPSGSHEHINFGDVWNSRGRLRGAYGGANGRRLGLNAKERPFDMWIVLPESHHMEHFKLIAVEYSSATELLCGELAGIVEAASSPSEVATLLIEKWSECIERSKRSS